MTIAAGTHWQIIGGSAAGNVNGGGFNIGNANFLTDLTTDTNTANTSAPVISSASYTFVAGDVGAWIYIRSGTNWTPGFYPIASIAGGKATLNAAVGAGYQLSSTYNKWLPNTIVGIATVGTPTAGTFGVDYSHQATAQIAGLTDFNSVGASTTLTSATGAFTRVMVGNIFHQTTTGTGAFGLVGWYEIVNYTNATTIVLDRAPNNGTASVNTTGYVGGSMSLNSTTDDAFHEAGVAGNYYWYKGNITLGQTVTVALNGTSLLPINHIGYNTTPGDSPTPFGLTPLAPLLNTGAFEFTFTGAFHNLEYLNGIGTGSRIFFFGTGSINRYLKAVNNSTSGGRNAMDGLGSCELWNFEAVSQRGPGIALSSGQNFRVYDGYIHDSATGIDLSQANSVVSRCIFANVLIGIQSALNGMFTCDHCTFHGSAGTPITGSVAVNMSAAVSQHWFNNNIFDGFETIFAQATTQNPTNKGQYNAYYNYTTLATRYSIDQTDLVAVNPQYHDVAEITGTGGTSTGSTITITGADLSNVQDNVDFIRVISATTAFPLTYLITAHNDGADTVTVSPAIGTGTNIVYQIPIGHDYIVGTNLKGTGFPGQYQGADTISHTNQGAVQRRTNKGAGGGSATFVG